MIRVEADAVNLSAYCLEKSTRPSDDDGASSTSGGWCFPRRRRKASAAPSSPNGGTATLPASRVVGADADPQHPGRVRVWYAERQERPQANKGRLRGYVCPPPLRVRVSAPVDVGGGSAEADAVVAAVRALATTASSSSQPPTPPPPRRVVAIVNPVSGRGRALRDFERDARPILERAAGLRVTLLPTQRAGHARELARGLQLDDEAGEDSKSGGVIVLAVVGGDGTLHEVINGLLSRPDWRRVCCGGGGGSGPTSAPPPPLLRLAHIPCGSGNGVAVSCGLRDAQTAAAAIAKGESARLDVTSVLVRTHGGQAPTMVAEGANAAPADAPAPRLTRTFCALSVVYGMMANLDVRTEPLRFLGEARFTLGGALEILGARSYACRGAWVAPMNAAAASAPGFLGEEDVGSGDDGEEEEEEEEGGAFVGATESALLAGGRARSCDLLAAAASADADVGGVSDDDLLGDGGPPLPALARLLRAAGSGGAPLPDRIPGRAHLKACGWRPLPVAANKSGGGKKGVGGGGGGGVHMFAAVGPPYVAGNYRFNPLGALSSGSLRQMWVPGHSVRGAGGRLASLALQDAAAEGTHLDAAKSGGLMRHAAARALALEPRAREGETWVQLDGEVVRGAVHGAALWAEVHEGLLSVVVAPGHPEAEQQQQQQQQR